ncbi:MAG: signal recognition particle protein [Fidelibacterota bacterium]
MFDQLTDRLHSVLQRIRGLGVITEKNINDAAREVRRVLLEADVNVQVVRTFIQRVREQALGTQVTKSIKPGELFIKILRDEMVAILGEKPVPLNLSAKPPVVILMAGLQGSGKTTTCAKLAHYLSKQDKKVLLVAADLYRPAAIEQLQSLAKKQGLLCYTEPTVDAVTVCEHALNEAREENLDIVIMDTAGRLHVDGEMMVEVQQIAEAVKPTETLFVVDGMTGQDAVLSAQAFNEALELTGIILTKIDGDARGGAALSIAQVTQVPIKFMGVSEKMTGLELFDPVRIADRILGFGDVISLVEKAQAVMDEKAFHLVERNLAKNQFTLEDFRTQLTQLQKMGPLNQLVGMMPGMSRKGMQGLALDDRQLVWTRAIIDSMTTEERCHPERINGSRRQRIARGSGRPVQEVNQLLKQFHFMKKMMKQVNKRTPFNRGKFPVMGLN